MGVELTDKENLSSIVKAFCSAVETIVFLVHPRTEKYLREYGLFDMLYKHVRFIPPAGYLLKLMTHSMKILPDSGGIRNILAQEIWDYSG